MKRRDVVLGGLAGAAAALASPPSIAQEQWPARPVKIIVPWPPGGSSSVMASNFIPKLQEVLGKPVAMETRPGGGGSVGAAEAAKANPDGYTWLLAYDTQATNEHVLRLPFRTADAFAPVTQVVQGPLVLVAGAQSPYKTLQDVVAAAKAKPGEVSYATSGAGSPSHVAAAMVARAAGINLTHIGYRGGGPALQDVTANKVPLFISSIVNVGPALREGKVRALGVTTRTESAHLPGVPSFASMGYSDVEALTWWCLLAPSRTPEAIQTAMSQAMLRVLADDSVKTKIREQGADVVGGNPDQAKAFLWNEIQKWGQVIQDNNITVDS